MLSSRSCCTWRRIDPEQEVNLYINSDGGDPAAMLAIYDTMQFIKAPVATTCIGQAVATGAVLLAAGAPGRRAVLPHSRVVLHQPAAQGRGTIPDLILQADEVVRVRSQLEAILATAHRPQLARSCATTPIATACSTPRKRWPTGLRTGCSTRRA